MKRVKTVGIIALVFALMAAGFYGIKAFRDSKVEVEVIPVSNLSWGFFSDEMSIEGMVYDQDSQAIYPSATQIIEEVFVTEGQKVQAGDKLLAFDNSSQEITHQLKQLAVQRAQVELDNAYRELNKLYNTTPISPNYDPGSGGEPEPEPDPEPEPEPTPPKKEKIKDAWNILDEGSINSFYLLYDDTEEKLKEAEEALKEAEEARMLKRKRKRQRRGRRKQRRNPRRMTPHLRPNLNPHLSRNLSRNRNPNLSRNLSRSRNRNLPMVAPIPETLLPMIQVIPEPIAVKERALRKPPCPGE